MLRLYKNQKHPFGAAEVAAVEWGRMGGACGGARLEMEGVVATAVVVLLVAGAARGGEWCGGSSRSGWEERFWGSPEKFFGSSGGGRR
nr:hypothetical protein [Tanacetum cinerariifolium]